jgi:hypothetical protein
VGVANRASRKSPAREAQQQRLEVERFEPAEFDVTKLRPHVAGKQRPVIAGGFGAKPAIDCRVQPPIEVFIKDRVGFGTRRDLGEEARQLGLCRGTLAVNCLIKVAPLAGRRIPSLVEAYQPGIGRASDDLAAGHETISHGL